MRGSWWSCIEGLSKANNVGDAKLDMFARIRCHPSYTQTAIREDA